MSQQKNKNQKIAIIGAGIAGLTAAYTLRKKGYTNITIFEAEDRVGGKVFSVEKDGRIYELGAIILMRGSRLLEGIAEEYSQKTTDRTSRIFIYSGGEQISQMKYLLKNSAISEIIKGIPGIFKIATIYKKFLKNNNIGFSGADPVLYSDFNEFLRRHGIRSVGLLAEPASAGFGYGHIDSTPALYYLKMMQIGLGYVIKDLFNSSFGPKLYTLRTFDNGYQKFLEAIAKDFNVRFGTRVEKIDRIKHSSSAEIEVTANEVTEKFNRVIISSMPDDILRFLDADENEKEIFSRVNHYRFQVTMFSGNIPLKSDALYFDPSILAEHRGFPGALSQLHNDRSLYTAYQVLDSGSTAEGLRRQLYRMADMLGGTIDNIILSKKYKYFPHFLENDLSRLRPYERLEEMQGRYSTYFIGGLYNFEGTEQTAEWAEHIINKNF